ncbi:unnamed protein product [Effrenium voratum]|uniref:Nudix hydrolase domain-containing protein n=1 Tax=Effrenium voratum TaxID=2562239 RepID=A0AA36I5I3_9DINO|nr:unnamed protein product [Effrenium voratum]CAJ1381471.1 unnamed protein product [Effrenium voratum]CAJ1444930.1 unnamed protein product [Effrenium voratum]
MNCLLSLLVTASAVLGAEHDGHDGPCHAGCFVHKNGTMLAVKLTYDGNKFDIPGGQTNWQEPATRTAQRETWEESGYEVTIGPLLATVRGGSFRIYECFLNEPAPKKNPDHEVSSVLWMNEAEIVNHVQEHTWRFEADQAHLYIEWLRNLVPNGQNHSRRLLLV